jgi:glucose/arabinose dehydrogenase
MVAHMKRRILLGILITLLAAAVWFFLGRSEVIAPGLENRPPGISEQPTEEEPKVAFEIVADHLTVPWEIAFLSDGDFLITERPGTLKRIGKNSATYAIEGVQHVGEGGLLGMALHPKFSDNHWLYLYLTTRTTGEGLTNRVERYTYDGDKLTEKKTVIDRIPGASNHDGGRMGFGPDGKLYITTGDASQSELAQNTKSLAGKILRLNDDGSIPSDNPFGNAVWTYGHRNPQGLAWDDQGRLWATEHGSSGIQSGLDELNLIEKGKNYGWPTIQGDQTKEGMERPVIHSGASTTWAPAGLVFKDGALYFGGLRGEALYRTDFTEGTVRVKALFQNEFGRIRAVVVGPGDSLYISTSNTDGRGTVQPNDDKIIKLNDL